MDREIAKVAEPFPIEKRVAVVADKDSSHAKPDLSQTRRRWLFQYALDECVGSEVDRHHIDRSFGCSGATLRMVLDTQGLRVDDDAEIAEVGGVVVFERKRVVDLVGRAVDGAHGGERRVASASRDQKRNLKIVDGSREALVVVCVAGEDGVGP